VRPLEKFALAVSVLVLARAAGADIAPDPSVEARCNIEAFQKEGEECVICRTSQADPDACKREHAQGGWAPQCQRSGAGEWTEIWCRVKPRSPGPEPSSAPVPDPVAPASAEPSREPPANSPDKKAGSCGACEIGAASGTPSALGSAILLMMGFMLRRRMR
jgi:hypothetical protein